MHAQTATPDQLLKTAIDAVAAQGVDRLKVLDRLPAPIYVTDSDGRITYFNRACIDLAGRTPELGKDRWCVTWKLYTQDGAFLPHDQCPMAVAIREKREIRGVEAVAERPDGSRVPFRPYPTPVLDEAGDVIGAVNMLIDVTDLKQVEQLKAQAARCRRLVQSVNDEQTVDTLTRMAGEYEDRARMLQRAH